MKLVFEMLDGKPYLYRESEKHHKKVQKTRKSKQLSPEILDEECFLPYYGRDFHIVFELKK